jgi:DNA-binding NtrC family response regulator
MGEGTIFDIYFPLIAMPAVNLLPKEMGSTPDKGNEFVLLVEDNAAMRLSVEDALTRFGYCVESAADGNEALGILAREGGGVSLVLTDLIMPKMDGLQLSEAIQQRYPGMKILIMTGHTLQESRLQALQETAVPWLTKPFSLQALSQKIREVLDQE